MEKVSEVGWFEMTIIISADAVLKVTHYNPFQKTWTTAGTMQLTWRFIPYILRAVLRWCTKSGIQKYDRENPLEYQLAWKKHFTDEQVFRLC
jgi:hypothetical protein